MINIQNYIDGQLYDPIDQRYLDVWNPSNGKIYAKCPNSNNQDLKFAISRLWGWSNDQDDFQAGIRLKIFWEEILIN